jgi:hypothetical protein
VPDADGTNSSTRVRVVRCVGSCGHVSLRQAINVVASRDPSTDGAYPLLKAPGWGDWLSGPASDRGGW